MWDYPRPPALEPVINHLLVVFAGRTIAETRRAHRVLETSQPPAYYFPPDDVDLDLLVRTASATFCEWKGAASYHSIRAGDHVAVDAAWSYAQPVDAFAPIRHHLAFYPQRVDACFVDDEQVRVGEGQFYGGWITSKVVGPFKGGAGTAHW